MFHHFQHFSQNSNVDGQNLCRWTVLRKISLFGKMQRVRSPYFEHFQLDMYENEVINTCVWESAELAEGVVSIGTGFVASSDFLSSFRMMCSRMSCSLAVMVPMNVDSCWLVTLIIHCWIMGLTPRVMYCYKNRMCISEFIAYFSVNGVNYH